MQETTMRTRRALVVLASTLLGSGVLQASDAAMTTQAYDALFAAVSNAGRWGADDTHGTLNLVTPEMRVAAAREVKSGVTVSLSRRLQPGNVPGVLAPAEVEPSAADDGDIHWEIERLAVTFHGYAFSHLDALSHASYKGRSYGGTQDRQRIGVEAMVDGLVSRGVLVDLPALRGVPYLEPGATYGPMDMEAWEKRTGVTIGKGDVLLIRTGRWVRQDAKGPADGLPGPHPAMARWLRDRGVAVVGDDGANDSNPSVVPGLSHPFHMLALVSMVMPLLDNMDLDALATRCASSKRWTFLFVAEPLRIQGSTGSPLNPLAVF
jgi:kynurenine formamidase